MIEFNLGKTGSGKSFKMVKDLIGFLVDTNCYIVTNLPLEMGELNDYLRRKYPRKEIDLMGRVRLLEKDETRQFYLHREHGNDLEPSTKQQEKIMQFPDFEGAAVKSGKPVVYFLDEAHIYWDSRAWAEVGLTMNYYCSQHEKFAAYIILCTQFLDQVELRLRKHANEFHECVNHAMRNLFIFQQPKYFTVLTTYKPPPCPPDTTERYTLDLEIAKCYRSTGGIGVFGRIAQRFHKKRKGLPWWTVFAAAPILILGLSYGPGYIWDWFTKKEESSPTRTESRDVGARGEAQNGARPFSPTGGPSGLGHEATEKEERYVTGTLRKGERFVIVWNDGTVTTQSENELPETGVERVRRTHVKIKGVVYPVKPNTEKTKKPPD